MNAELVAKILSIVFGANIILSALKGALDKIAATSKNPAIQKADSILGSVATILGKILDVIGYNPQH